MRNIVGYFVIAVIVGIFASPAMAADRSGKTLVFYYHADW
jgi:hypothetical protein